MRKTTLFVLLFFLQASIILAIDNPYNLKQSYFKLTTSNGLIVSVYNAKTNRIDYVYPHIFARTDSAHYVHPFVGNIVLNSDEKPESTTYLKNTHVIESKYKNFEVYYLASFTEENKVFYIAVRGKKEDIEHLNFTAETISGSPVSGLDHLENDLEDLPCRIDGNAITGTYLKPYKGDVYERYFLYSFTDTLHTDKDIVNNAIVRLKESKTSLVDDEVAYMRSVIARTKIPTAATEKERNVLQQAVTMFKMAQVSEKEVFPNAAGQIIAALRPGLWHIAWVRDGSFAIQAMTRLGMYDEARKGLEFMLKAPANRFKNYTYTDGIKYGPGVDYQISLTRYFGNGTEECDWNEFGPNIEYDNFGLFLTTFSDYVIRSGDWDFFAKWDKVVASKVADPIVHVIAPNGLIKADSGPWEHHFENPKQYAFTSGVCARGLELYTSIRKQKNLPYKEYQSAAAIIKKGIEKNMLTDGRYIKGNANDTDPNAHEYWDAGTFEVFANGLLDQKELFTSHINAYGKTLGISGDRPGYIRLRSSDPYENQEWVFINLRIAYAHLLHGDKESARALIDFITEQASRNNNTIPEMISNKAQMDKVTPNHYQSEFWCNCIRQEDNLYIGIIPMVGYGSGAYTIALLEYYGM